MPSTRRPDDDFDDRDPADDPLGPGEETFWQKYNPHLEFPTSVLISIFTLTLSFGFIVLVVVAAMLGTKDTSPVPISLVEGGFDDFGAGSPGFGGEMNPLTLAQAQASAPQQRDFENLPLTKDLPQVREDLKQAIAIDDPTAVGSIPDEKAAAYGALDEALRNKMLGQNKGVGKEPGKGDSGQAGGGPGGTGASSTRARSLRWILRFSTRSGRDYLDQLHSLGAVVLTPVPPDNKQMYIFRDLKNPKPGTLVTEAEWQQLSQQIQFCDFKRESVVAVGEALGLSQTPNQFWAFFPKGLEEELSRLEVQYKNKRPEDIESTVFVVTVVGGRPKLVVAEQTLKR